LLSILYDDAPNKSEKYISKSRGGHLQPFKNGRVAERGETLSGKNHGEDLISKN
jgi:hypothetical protein